MPPAFSSFRKRQLTLEMRHDEAFLLWDFAGRIWQTLGSHFRDLKSRQASPNETIFFADGRYALNVSLQRASVTDFAPTSTWDDTNKTLAAFVSVVSEALNLRTLTRVGARFMYALEFKSLEDARKKAQDFGWAALPTKSLFRIEPRSVGPTFKLEVDDGELAYVAQIYPQEKKVAFLTTPDAAAVFGLKDVKKERYDLILDLDFATKKPVRMESFDTMSWLAGWQRAINQDAETFLNLKVQ